MKIKIILISLLISILLFSTLAFSESEVKMDFYGEITKVVFDEQGNVEEIHLDNIAEDGRPYDKAVAIITDNTDIRDQAKNSQLEEGQNVGILFKDGPMLMIYPPQIEAEIINILSDGENNYDEELINKPQIKVAVDREREENDQKSVDQGHSPWKLDPAFVAQVFVSLQLSPEGITEKYPINIEELVLKSKTEQEAIIEISSDKTPINRVCLEKIVRQDSTGIWSVVGYDLKEEEIVGNFKALIENRAKLSEIIDFIDSNIKFLSKENASIIINEFEILQKLNYSNLEKKFYERQIQDEISSIYMQKFDLNMINNKDEIYNIKDRELRELLLETIDNGYKVETAEGMYYPIINYEFYNKYTPYLTPDFKEYIKLMAVESSNPPAKDGALVIDWEEILNRALAQENFLVKFPEAMKVVEVKDLFEKYLNFTFYGLNNTPLFSYDTEEIADEVKDIYLEIIRNNPDSNLVEALGRYMNILKENNYILTDVVNNYRKDILDNMFFAYEFYYPIIKDTLKAMQNNIDMLKEESNVQRIEESNYGDMYQMTRALKVTENELLFDAVEVVFSSNYKGHFTPGKIYPYYTDAAMGGQRGITLKDDFGIWHSFGWRVPVDY